MNRRRARREIAEFWGARAFCSPFAAFCREPTRGVRAGGEYSWATRKAELSVKMPDIAGNMPALPQK